MQCEMSLFAIPSKVQSAVARKPRLTSICLEILNVILDNSLSEYDFFSSFLFFVSFLSLFHDSREGRTCLVSFDHSDLHSLMLN